MSFHVHTQILMPHCRRSHLPHQEKANRTCSLAVITVASKKEPERGAKAARGESSELDGQADGPVVVAVDAVGAGVVNSFCARALRHVRRFKPKFSSVDHVVVAIIDQVKIEVHCCITKITNQSGSHEMVQIDDAKIEEIVGQVVDRLVGSTPPSSSSSLTGTGSPK